MSLDSYWFKVFHVVGVTAWIAGLIAMIVLLLTHSKVDSSSRPFFVQAEKFVGIAMDIGATVAISCGLIRAFGMTPNAFQTGGWLHMKLTAVFLGIFCMHGMVRVKARKFRNGDLNPLPSWVLAAVVIASVIAITLATHPSLMRK